MENVFPYLSHKLTVPSFDDYLKRMSFLPSCKWLKEMETTRFARVAFTVNPEELVKKYKDRCVTYNAPMRPEDGVQRIIYQISPTFHMEVAIWIWVESNVVNSYASMFVCFSDDQEYYNIMKELFKIRRTGNTEDNSRAGFMFANSLPPELKGT